MTQASEQIASQYVAAAINKQQWGSAMYNVLAEGLVGGGTTNDTDALQTLINKAIAAGRKAIFFPHGTNGTYKVTSLTNADQVVFFGDNASFVGGYRGVIHQIGHESMRSGVPTTIITDVDNSYNSWPVIAKAANGDILVFYNKGVQHLNGDTTRKVVYKRSTDNGLNFSDEVTVLDDAYDDSIFSIGTPSSGTIVVIIRRVTGAAVDYDNVVMRSLDHGVTWSAPATISVLPATTILVSPIVEIPGYGLMAGFNNRPYTCELIWSTDDGVTWGNRQTIIIPADPNDAPLEPRFVYLGAGKIFGIGRTNQAGKGLFQLQSADYGATWTVLRTNITDQYMTPAAVMTQNNEIDLVYYHRGNGAIRQRHANADAIWSNPLMWRESKVLAYGSPDNSDAGYPHAVNLADDTCFCVFYSGDTDTAGIFGFHYSLNNNLYFKTPMATTAALTYYVNVATGSDTNDGLTAGTPFRTIAMAINILPQIINHAVVINVAAGNYTAEGTIVISGFTGKNTISLLGDTAATTTYIFSRLSIVRNSINITVRGFKGTSAAGAISTLSCINVAISFCSCTDASANDGYTFTNSTVTISNSVASNRGIGINCINSRVFSDTNSGTTNTIGLKSSNAGTIGKNGTQPAGTTAESATAGGVIR